MESTQELEILKSRSFGDIVSFTFTFLRENFRELAKCILFIAGPGVLLSSVASAYVGAGGLGSSGNLFLSVLIMIVVLALLSTVINEFVVLHAEKGPGGFTFNDVWEETRRDVGKVVITTIVTGLAVFVGFGFLILPGVYLGVVTSIIIPVRINERIRLGEAFSRSVELAKENWWLTFGLLAMMVAISLVLRSFFSIPLWISVAAGELGGSERVSWLVMIGSVISSFGGFFASSIPILAFALHYFNLVEKHEGIGILDRIAQIGQPDDTRSIDAGTI